MPSVNDDDELHTDDEGYDDDGFNEDLEALRRACTLSGTNPVEFNTDSPADFGKYDDGEEEDEEEEEDNDDDCELFRNIKNKYSIPMSVSDDFREPISLKPLCALPPDNDNGDDEDFETLCAVRRRFAAYESNNALGRRTENLAEKPEDVSNVALANRRACKVFPDIEEDDHTTNSFNDTQEMQQSGLIVHQTLDENHELLCLGLQDSSSLPKSAHVLLYAIRRNRSSQKFLQSKLAQIEVRIEENKKLKERVKFLRDFQVSCRKLTGRALAQGKDPRIQLISARRIVSSKDPKINDKKVSAMYDGPVENAQVVNYREAFKDYPLTLKNKKWTHEEKENLKKGIRQQFQEMVLQFSVDQLSGSEGSLGYVTDWDKILPSIRDLEITPERCREFLPKVNWDQLASLYVVNRTGAECEAQS